MRNGRIGLVSALALASTMATVGCGSNANNGGAGGSSGSGGSGAGGTSGEDSVTSLSGSKAINALTTTEATQLCTDAYAYFGRAISRATMCKWNGLTFALSTSASTDAQLQANCKTKESSCLQEAPANPGCGDLPSTCAATVKEYSACMTEQAMALNDAVPKFPSCATFTTGDKPQIWDFVSADLPASCMSLTNKCASLNFPSPQ